MEGETCGLLQGLVVSSSEGRRSCFRPSQWWEMASGWRVLRLVGGWELLCEEERAIEEPFEEMQECPY